MGVSDHTINRSRADVEQIKWLVGLVGFASVAGPLASAV